MLELNPKIFFPAVDIKIVLSHYLLLWNVNPYIKEPNEGISTDNFKLVFPLKSSFCVITLLL